MLPLLLMDDSSDNETLMFFMMMSSGKTRCEPELTVFDPTTVLM